MELFWVLFWQIIKKFGKWAAGGKKKISIATFHIRCSYLARELHRLRAGKLIMIKDGNVTAQPRYKLANPYNLKRKHVDALVADWLARGLSAAYIHNMLSMFRVFAIWIGKPNLIVSTVDVVPDPARKRRRQVAVNDKSWSQRGINIMEKLALIAKSDLRVAMVLELMWMFGLRLKEASLLCPWLADQDSYLDIARGTKGGRDRTHIISTHEQRDLIERIKSVVDGKNACCIPRGMSYRSWQNHVYYLLRTHGITRKTIGTSTHGLRNQNLNDLYEAIADAPSPVRGGQPGDVKPEIDRFARQQVAEAAGHGRRRASSAYLGAVLQRKNKKGGGASNPPATAGITPPDEGIKHKDVDSIPVCPNEQNDEK